jgi:hypothetical protein
VTFVFPQERFQVESSLSSAEKERKRKEREKEKRERKEKRKRRKGAGDAARPWNDAELLTLWML